MRRVRVLFRAAAGPRLGFGHLVRARALARALGIGHPAVSLRGGAGARRAAADLGFALVDGTAAHAIARLRPDIVVIDEPSARAASGWRRTAAKAGIRVASVHDLRLGFCDADLTVDGSLTARPWGRAAEQLIGPRFAILDPRIVACRGQRRVRGRVLIALGGGPRVSIARRLATEILRARPDLEVRVAGGFGAMTNADSRIVWVPATPGLVRELASCTVAVVAGGVTLYEAAVLETPSVIWPVVPAQHATVKAFARAGYGRPVLPGPDRIGRAVREVLTVVEAPSSIVRPIPGLDGKGAWRVAAAVRQLASGLEAQAS